MVTQRAAELAARRGIALSFSITTNGTLLNDSDAGFFEEHGFAVTISLDGPICSWIQAARVLEIGHQDVLEC